MMISSNAKSRPLKKVFLVMEMKIKPFRVNGGLSFKDKKPGETF